MFTPSSIIEYGHAKDHPDLEQINMGMVVERSRNIPILFELYGGSIPDIVTLKRTVENIIHACKFSGQPSVVTFLIPPHL